VDPELVARLERVIAGQEKIMERFAQLDRQNIDLRDQVAETNRDVMELQFRVDSHSESFRPLRAVQVNTLAPDSSVLPPRE
jgi:malonyl CoA-acyl carrier protein transacylase